MITDSVGLGRGVREKPISTVIPFDLTMVNSSATLQAYLAVRNMVGLNLFAIKYYPVISFMKALDILILVPRLA